MDIGMYHIKTLPVGRVINAGDLFTVDDGCNVHVYERPYGAGTVEIRRAVAAAFIDEAGNAYQDWRHRTELPRGIEADADADMTLFYANNTIYGEMKGGGEFRLEKWKTRPQRFVASLINGDYFLHGYTNVDFGGSRGWENQFQSTVIGGGVGPWFTFGRAHWWINAGGPWGLIDVPPADEEGPGRHKVVIDVDFEPTRRLRMYQFDPYHHDVAIFSIH